MANLDPDTDVAQLEEETRESARERLESGRYGNYNPSDPTSGWTAQQGGLPQDVTDTRQKFSLSQLPDPAVARSAGMPPLDFPEDLIVGETEQDAVTDPHGPEPYSAALEPQREELRDVLVDAGVTSVRNPAKLNEDERPTLIPGREVSGDGRRNNLNPGITEQTDPNGPGQSDSTEDEDGDEYDGMTVAELKEQARSQGVEGYSTMRREELLTALRG